MPGMTRPATARRQDDALLGRPRQAAAAAHAHDAAYAPGPALTRQLPCPGAADLRLRAYREIPAGYDHDPTPSASSRPRAYPVREEDMARLSPFVSSHLGVHGTYSFVLPDLVQHRINP